jgi:hypothetical protein
MLRNKGIIDYYFERVQVLVTFTGLFIAIYAQVNTIARDKYTFSVFNAKYHNIILYRFMKIFAVASILPLSSIGIFIYLNVDIITKIYLFFILNIIIVSSFLMFIALWDFMKMKKIDNHFLIVVSLWMVHPVIVKALSGGSYESFLIDKLFKMPVFDTAIYYCLSIEVLLLSLFAYFYSINSTKWI